MIEKHIKQVENNYKSLNNLYKEGTKFINTDQAGLVKHTRTGAIINKNINELNNIKDKIKYSKEIKKMSEDIDELKMLVKSLLENRK